VGGVEDGRGLWMGEYGVLTANFGYKIQTLGAIEQLSNV